MPTQANTAGNILSLGFLLLNIVGALLPMLLLKRLCLRWGEIAVHRTAMGSMAAGYVVISVGTNGELFYYLGMLLCGIGWASLISIVLAIFSEYVSPAEMGVSMGVFNSGLVLPALAVPGLLKLSDAFGNHSSMCSPCLHFVSLFRVPFGVPLASERRTSLGVDLIRKKSWTSGCGLSDQWLASGR